MSGSERLSANKLLIPHHYNNKNDIAPCYKKNVRLSDLLSSSFSRANESIKVHRLTAVSFQENRFDSRILDVPGTNRIVSR